jgi:HD-GYP domain-containing protein (c-di-GMP phosphodiesterase class II)
LDVFIIIYLDDILIFSKTEEEYKGHIKKILKKLIDENLRIKTEKTEFHAKEVDFLDFVIGREGVKMDKKNINNIKIADVKNNQRCPVLPRIYELLPQVYPRI